MFFTPLHFASAWTLLVILALTGISSAESRPQGSGDMLGPALGPNQLNCLRSIDGRPGLPSTSLAAQSDCELGLPSETSLLEFSYSEQRMDPASVADPHKLSEYLGDETNTLARSVGTFALLANHLANHLTAEVEFGHSHVAREGIPEPFSNEGMAARLGLRGEWGRTRYWAEYGFFDKEFTNLRDATPQDQAGAKLGAEFDWGILKPRMEFSRFHNNVAGNPTLSQTTTSKGLVSLDLGVAEWPSLKLAYGGEYKETASRPNGTMTEEVISHRLSGTLSYQRPSWEAYLTSSYSLKQDELNADSDTVVYDYVLGGVYRPMDVLKITPNVKFAQEFNGPTDVRTDKLSANLGFYYTISEGSFALSLNGSYIDDRSSDRSVDSQTLKGSLSLEKHLGDVFGLPHEKASLSLKTNYSRTVDRANQDADADSYSVLFLLEVIP